MKEIIVSSTLPLTYIGKITQRQLESNLWGAADILRGKVDCGKDGIIRINWQLVQAPLAAMEYVVAHEVVHLLHRHHGDVFWETLGSVMPDWRERKALLESWEFVTVPGIHL